VMWIATGGQQNRDHDDRAQSETRRAARKTHTPRISAAREKPL
jgi:hypothetical protein